MLVEHSHPQLGGASYRLPCPSRSFFWVYKGRAFSGVPCVSPGELISGCDPPSGEAAQRLAYATSKQGLDREVQAALLRVRTGPECPQSNVRELT